MIYIALILVILLIICSFLFGYSLGKFKGAKDSIDYCFDQYEKKLNKTKNNLN